MGGGPRTEGAFYDVAYDRSLDPPTITTGNGVAGTGPEGCTPNSPPTGMTTEFDEGIDIDQTKLNGGAPAGVDGGIPSIDPLKLERDAANNCAPVYGWDFVRTNTIFGVIHAAGGYTAWSDKHPSYSSVSGHGTGGKAIDDYHSPEINSIPVALPGMVAQGVKCDPLPDQTAVSSSNAWTDSFQNIQCYDQLKVNAVLNWINGRTHNGLAKAPRPVLLGMNFQVVSVGEKLIEKSLKLRGGYLDSIGTPTASLLSEIKFADASIGDMVAALTQNRIYDSTLIVITAKHGQSPVDSARYLGISNSTGDPITTSPATILDGFGCLPFSESPSNPTGIGPTEDDVSQVWLNSNCTTQFAVSQLRSASLTTNNVAGIGQILSGPILTTYFNRPGLSPNGDPRTPDIITIPGSLDREYSIASLAKLASKCKSCAASGSFDGRWSRRAMGALLAAGCCAAAVLRKARATQAIRLRTKQDMKQPSRLPIGIGRRVSLSMPWQIGEGIIQDPLNHSVKLFAQAEERRERHPLAHCVIGITGHDTDTGLLRVQPR